MRRKERQFSILGRDGLSVAALWAHDVELVEGAFAYKRFQFRRSGKLVAIADYGYKEFRGDVKIAHKTIDQSTGSLRDHLSEPDEEKPFAEVAA